MYLVTRELHGVVKAQNTFCAERCARRAGWIVSMVILLVNNRSAFTSEVTVTDIVENIRANESLFDNFEATVSMSYQLLRKPVEFVDEDMVEVTDSSSEVNYTQQDGMFRLEIDLQSTDAGKKLPDTRRRVRMYDGETSRAKEGTVVNIAEGRTNDEYIIRPHMMIIQRTAFDVPLSVYLQGRDAIIAFAGESEIGDMQIEVDYVGEEEIDGLRCHKMVCRHIIRGSGVVFNVVHMWLAPERNWLPLKCKAVKPHLSNTLSSYDAVTTEFVRVAPGIWFPKNATVTAFNKDLLGARGEQVPAWRRSYVVEACTMNTKHPKSYFQDFDISAGSAVYRLNSDGKIVGSYLEGAPDPQKQSWLWRNWLILLNIAVIVVIVSLMLWRRMTIAKSA